MHFEVVVIEKKAKLHASMFLRQW